MSSRSSINIRMWNCILVHLVNASQSFCFQLNFAVSELLKGFVILILSGLNDPQPTAKCHLLFGARHLLYSGHVLAKNSHLLCLEIILIREGQYNCV